MMETYERLEIIKWLLIIALVIILALYSEILL